MDSNESALLIRWPKYWSFRISPSTEYSGLISFGIVYTLIKNILLLGFPQLSIVVFLFVWGFFGPLFKNPLSNAEDEYLIPGWGTKIPHTLGQLSLHASTKESSSCNKDLMLP